MNWQDHLRKWIECVAIVALCTVASFSIWNIAFGPKSANEAVASSLRNVPGTVDRINSTLDAADAPCKEVRGKNGNTGAWECGPIAQLSQTEKNVGIVAAKAAEQVMQNGKLLQSAVTNLNQTSAHVNDEIESMRKLTDAATNTANQTTTDLQTVDGVVSSFRPIPNQMSVFLAHTDDTVNGVAVRSTLNSISGMAVNFDQASGDFAKRFHAILYPPPCRTFGCRLQKYAWPIMKDGAAFGSDVYSVEQIFGKTIPVRITAFPFLSHGDRIKDKNEKNVAR
ncbi:MAG TPA: hypothetical protein VFW94_24350 [Candidatus Acidoferrales bacterium]|nr:hypothetical protein [Candidatus Acidoferrales bacterium]